MIKWTVLILLATVTVGVASIVVFKRPFTDGAVLGSFMSFLAYCFIPVERP